MFVAVHAPQLSGPFTVVGSAVGALLALADGGWMALSTLRGPSQQEAPPRLHRV